jgi:hypothetical protein
MNANALNFDLNAWAYPKTRADLIALADEALRELQNIEDILAATFAKCEQDLAAATREAVAA